MIEKTKILRLGRVREGDVFVKITVTREDGKTKLSFIGVEGPMSNGDCRGSCGQIDRHLKSEQFAEFAPGWNAEAVEKLLATWDRWHLNNMRAGCEHQRAEKWNERPIDPSKPLDVYGKHCGPNGPTTWNMLTWVTRKDHPKGLMCEPCPTCGYKHGTAWLHEPVPDEVLSYLGGLPSTDKQPAWV